MPDYIEGWNHLMAIEFVFLPTGPFEPYVPDSLSKHRLKLSFSIELGDGGQLEGTDVFLDLKTEDVCHPRAAEMLVSSLNLQRTGPVTIRSLEVVPRGTEARRNPTKAQRHRDARTSVRAIKR